ncbi:CsgG/HfaB family protein [Frigidibacter sp. SD6-1]|uniref:CsgG/HfaB family protein n=1 Tax=Frigidibacter sp. SD6-1 TaxID=3032581 RepID=UPI0024E02186|nr:CsgG/HfaB family protein [Frigidibacter sp. SD6-1]
MRFPATSFLPLVGLLGLAACSGIPASKVIVEGEAPVIIGPATRKNLTPLEPVYQCYDRKLSESRTKGKASAPPLNIAVGQIQDFTTRALTSERVDITQGGSLMVISALMKLRDNVTVHDRVDPRVTEAELQYMNNKYLGDGNTHDNGGVEVPWLPYFGGSIRQSEYTILGGITEVNYNLSSGGASLMIDQIGGRQRVYTINVAADLRLVRTSSLEVVAAVSLQKQFVGYERDLELFSFFDIGNKSRLFDAYAGEKSQEPLQLGIRAILEESTLALIADLTGVQYDSCNPGSWEYPETQPVVTAPKLPETDITARSAPFVVPEYSGSAVW